MKRRRNNHRPIAYVSFGTFLSVLENLKGALISRALNREDCGAFSDATWSQLCRALRVLDLLDDRNAPSELLKSLVQAKDRKRILREILKKHYPELFAAGLSRIERPRLDKILTTYGVRAATLRKARSFFLGAAQYSGVALSPNLRSGIRHRSARKLRVSTIETRTSTRPFDTVEPNLSENKTVSLTANDMTLTLTFRRGSLPEIEKTEHELLYHLFDELVSFKRRAAQAKGRHFTNIKA